MAKRGRPPKTDESGKLVYNVNDMIKKLDEYTDECMNGGKVKIPILNEAIRKYGWKSSRFYELKDENKELAEAIKRLTDAKQEIIEKLAYMGAINTTFAIFSLKQLGWRDNVKTERNVNVTGKMDTGKLDSILKQLEEE